MGGKKSLTVVFFFLFGCGFFWKHLSADTRAFHSHSMQSLQSMFSFQYLLLRSWLFPTFKKPEEMLIIYTLCCFFLIVVLHISCLSGHKGWSHLYVCRANIEVDCDVKGFFYAIPRELSSFQRYAHERDVTGFNTGDIFVKDTLFF